MEIKYINRYLQAAIVLVFTVSSTHIYAATINFTGSLGVIEIDNGSSTYSSSNIGDVFSGNFVYGNNSSDASSIDIISSTIVDYNFTGSPYGGFITDNYTTTTGAYSLVGVADADMMGDDTFYINNLYGTNVAYTTISDTLDIGSSNGNVEFGLTFYSLDTSLFTGTDLQNFSPSLSASDFAVFYIAENDSLGNTTYLATGKLTSIAVVPIPAAFWLFTSGVIGLFGMSWKKYSFAKIN